MEICGKLITSSKQIDSAVWAFKQHQHLYDMALKSNAEHPTNQSRKEVETHRTILYGMAEMIFWMWNECELNPKELFDYLIAAQVIEIDKVFCRKDD